MNRPMGETARCALYGVGLGPGDPDYVTVRAPVRQRADRLVHFCKGGRRGNARTIADALVRPTPRRVGRSTIPSRPRSPAERPRLRGGARRRSTTSPAAARGGSRAGATVAVLCEGDPLFYGSFMHLYAGWRRASRSRSCPGVTGMSGCWTRAGVPIDLGRRRADGAARHARPRRALAERLRGATPP